MRRPPPPHERGQPKTPGSGRGRGSLNRKTIALRELMAALVGDVEYQQRLVQAFRTRRVHPAVEIRVWEYALGRPRDQIELSGTREIDLDAERELFSRLDVRDLQQLATESQALIDKARAMAEARRTGVVAAFPPVASITIDAESIASTTVPASPASGESPIRPAGTSPATMGRGDATPD